MADEKKEVVEVIKNCAGCKKPVKKARRLFKAGKYYCNNNCWRKAKVAAANEAQTAEASK